MEYQTVNRYNNIIDELQSTFDLLKRSEVCINQTPSSIINKYESYAKSQHDGLIDDHRQLLDTHSGVKEQIHKINDVNNTQIPNSDEEINARKGFYQSIQTYERNWLIRFGEFTYFIVGVITLGALFTQGVGLLRVVLYGILFVIYPYFMFHYGIRWIYSGIHYIQSYNPYQSE